MSAVLVAPLVLVAAGLLAAWAISPVSAPATAARMLTAATAVAAAGVAAGLGLVVLAAASEVVVVSDAIGWCRALYPGDHGAAPWAGVVAAAVLAVAGSSAWRHVRRARRDVAAFGAVDGVSVVTTPGVVAHAVPGDRGGIVLGASLVRVLTAEERAVVLAHEHAHLDHGHHRYVLVAETCAAALPVLRPLARRVRFHTERWADEVAADQVGGRLTVAKTIAKVALLQPARASGVPAFGAASTVDRVDALLRPPIAVPPAASLLAATALATTAMGTTAQLHHLGGFLIHACGA